MTTRPNTQAARLEAHGASYEATLAALVRRAGKATPNARGGHDWTLGTGQQIATSRDGAILTIHVTGDRIGKSSAWRYYEVGGIHTTATPTEVAINLLQGTIDGELDSAIGTGQRAYRKLGL